MSWSERRKLIYATIAVGMIITVLLILYFSLFYRTPTCFDGIMNGSESGIDCGGKCSRLCQNAFLQPHIEWGEAKLEKVSDGLYNVSSYIVNPNIMAEL